MRAVHWGPAAGLVSQVALLAGLDSTMGLSRAGWTAGMVTGVVTAGLLVRALARRRLGGLGPADWVTLARASLVGAAAALIADSLAQPADASWRPTLVAVATVALVLDSVDGRVARRTGTVSPFGARFDMEVDAFLILVLSVRVAADGAAWVLAIGAARYVFVAAGWLLPWLRRPAPPRPWCKVVAALQGIVLTVAVAGVLPKPVTYAALLAAMALLAESFGRESWWLWRHRPARARRHLPAWGTRALTAGAAVLVWGALAAPDDVRETLLLHSVSWLPAEGLVLAVLLVVVPGRARAVLAVAAGFVLALLVLVKALDIGFLQALGRPFDPVADMSYAGSTVGLLGDSIGPVGAVAVGLALIGLAAGVLVVLPLAVLRLAREAGRHPSGGARAVVVLAAVWALVAALGVQAGPAVAGRPALASWSDARLAQAHVAQAQATLSERAAFDSASAHDPYSGIPGDQLLTALRGKDVLVVFVESYGRVALEGLPGSPQVRAAMDAGTRQLGAAGYGARSAFLTSPTFGGTSWLAHSTLQSGLWVNSQERYNQLIGGSRLTLSSAFHRAGWRTVADVPANRKDWPEGTAFYGYDHVYDSRNVGYTGPKFGYGPIPDQYTLAALDRLELDRVQRPDRPPVMAEVDLVSSHLPWAPLPRLVDWTTIGDGSVFDPMPSQAAQPGEVWRDRTSIRDAYAQSIIYSMDTLVSFLAHSSDPNLVVLTLGDHQPATVVSGVSPDRDVPVSIIARDPAVLDRISGWGWQPGLRPSPTAPVWRMDAFRDRFLAAYAPHTSVAAAVARPR